MKFEPSLVLSPIGFALYPQELLPSNITLSFQRFVRIDSDFYFRSVS